MIEPILPYDQELEEVLFEEILDRVAYRETSTKEDQDYLAYAILRGVKERMGELGYTFYRP